MSATPREGRRAIVEAAAVALLLAIGAAIEHARGGVELCLIALGAVFVGSTARRLLAARARIAPPPRALFAIELGALSAIVVYPIGRWAHALAGVAALALALPPIKATGEESPRASALEEITLALVAIASAAAAWLATRFESGPSLPLIIIITVALEAWFPRAPRSVAALARRAAALGLAAGAAIVHGHESQDDGPIAEITLTALASVAGFAALAEIVLRGFAARTEDELAARRRRALARGLVALGAIALVWLGGEAVFRFLPASDVTLGHAAGSAWHVPGKPYVYEGPPLGRRERRNEFVWNRDGFHDADHDVAKPARCVRIAVLGDSFVDGYQHALDDLIHRRLAVELAPRADGVTIEPLAFGCAGWGQIQELDALERTAARYSPDLVVLAFFCGNDVRNDSPELEALAQGESRSLVFRARAFAVGHGLGFSAFVLERVERALARLSRSTLELDADVYRERPERAELWEDAWARTDALFGAIDAACARAKARLVVLIVNGSGDVVGRPRGFSADDMRRPALRAIELLKKRGIACLDVSPRLARANERAEVFMPHDGHWSATGHRLAAAELARFLADETPIWRELVQRARR